MNAIFTQACEDIRGASVSLWGRYVMQGLSSIYPWRTVNKIVHRRRETTMAVRVRSHNAQTVAEVRTELIRARAMLSCALSLSKGQATLPCPIPPPPTPPNSSPSPARSPLRKGLFVPICIESDLAAIVLRVGMGRYRSSDSLCRKK